MHDPTSCGVELPRKAAHRPWGTTLVGTVPDGFRPKNQLRQRCQVANVDNSMSIGLWVQSGGAMYIANFGGTGLSGSYNFSCTACWPAV